MNLDAYFRRIAYAGPTTPTLDTLEALCLAHVRAIPFENLDVLLGRGIDLSDAAVDHKLITLGRGGYCFEQNPLFLRVITQLGFRAHAISARVRLERPRDFTPPRTHCFIALELDDERWLADVGVGGLSPTAPLRLDTDAEQPTPHEPRRIVREGALLFHQVKLGDAWNDVCEFTLEAMPPVDREVGNWFTSAHPTSRFRNRLLVARALGEGGRVTLLNQELTLRPRRGAAPQVTRLESPDALLATLDEHFGLRFPSGTRFHGPPFDWA